MSSQPLPLTDRLTLPPAARKPPRYLHHDLPSYPFDPDLDTPFALELHHDFPHLDLVEEVKLFRWYHDNQPPLDHHPRATLRRWIRGARARRSR
jgi:hypothetical protein